MNYTNLKKVDKEVFEVLKKETKRLNEDIDLIASENLVSPAVIETAGSVFMLKYSEGYPGKRYYGGCQFIDEVESLAIERAKKLFGAEHANVQPHSGSSANIAIYHAFLSPGDTILTMSLADGGHLTHGSPVNFSGKTYNVVHYGLEGKTQRIDYEELEKLALKHRPKLILAGASAYSREIDFKKFRQVADKVDAIFMVDMAHIAGLVATGLHQSPIPYADIVTSTTQKTLRGPRGGLILCKKEFAKKVDSGIFPGTQGGPLENMIAAKAVAFGEALTPEFKEYQKQIIKNIKAMEKVFLENDIEIISGGTDNHLLLLNVKSIGLTGKQTEELLGEIGIIVNKNTIPNETESPFIASGIRLGTPSVTTRGFKENDCKKTAEIIVDALKKQKSKDALKQEVNKLTQKYPLSAYDIKT